MSGPVFPRPRATPYPLESLLVGTEPREDPVSPQDIFDSGERRPRARMNSNPRMHGPIKWCRSCNRVLPRKRTYGLCEQQHSKELSKLRRDARRLPKTYRVAAEDLKRLQDLARDLAVVRATLAEVLRNRESISEPLQEVIRSSGAIVAHVHRRIPSPRG